MSTTYPLTRINGVCSICIYFGVKSLCFWQKNVALCLLCHEPYLDGISFLRRGMWTDVIENWGTCKFLAPSESCHVSCRGPNLRPPASHQKCPLIKKKTTTASPKGQPWDSLQIMCHFLQGRGGHSGFQPNLRSLRSRCSVSSAVLSLFNQVAVSLRKSCLIITIHLFLLRWQHMNGFLPRRELDCTDFSSWACCSLTSQMLRISSYFMYIAPEKPVPRESGYTVSKNFIWCRYNFRPEGVNINTFVVCVCVCELMRG